MLAGAWDYYVGAKIQRAKAKAFGQVHAEILRIGRVSMHPYIALQMMKCLSLSVLLCKPFQ